MERDIENNRFVPNADEVRLFELEAPYITDVQAVDILVRSGDLINGLTNRIDQIQSLDSTRRELQSIKESARTDLDTVHTAVRFIERTLNINTDSIK